MACGLIAILLLGLLASSGCLGSSAENPPAIQRPSVHYPNGYDDGNSVGSGSDTASAGSSESTKVVNHVENNVQHSDVTVNVDSDNFDGKMDIKNSDVVKNGKPIKATSGLMKTLYICSMYTVCVMDIDQKILKTRIDLGYCPEGMVSSPDGKKVFVACYEDKVCVIDTSSDVIETTINVSKEPRSVAISSDGRRLYVAGNALDVIDTSTYSIDSTIDLDGYEGDKAAVSPDGGKIFISDLIKNTVLAVDLSAQSVVSTIEVGEQPTTIAFTPDGRKAYVLDYQDEDVSVIDTSSERVISKIKVGKYPYSSAITPDGRKLYVANYRGPGVSVIDTRSDSVISTIPISLGAEDYVSDIIISPDGSKAYAEALNGAIYIIDVYSDSVTDRVDIQSGNLFVLSGT
jgi:YVTN family beta-propeller protein